MFRSLFILLLITSVQSVSAETQGSESALKSSSAGDPLEQSVQQLRDAIGEWQVVTRFLNDDAGKTWKPGNHQQFQRALAEAPE